VSSDKKIDLICHLCNSREGIKKVSSIVAEGTNVHKAERVVPVMYSESVTTPIFISTSNGYNDGFTESYRTYTRLETVKETSLSSTVIAQSLAFPDRTTLINIFSSKNPRPAQPKLYVPGPEQYIFSVFPAVIVGLVVYGLWEGWFIPTLLTIATFYFLHPRVSKLVISKEKKEKNRQLMEQYKQAMAAWEAKANQFIKLVGITWNNLFYCHRCDSLFIPQFKGYLLRDHYNAQTLVNTAMSTFGAAKRRPVNQ